MDEKIKKSIKEIAEEWVEAKEILEALDPTLKDNNIEKLAAIESVVKWLNEMKLVSMEAMVQMMDSTPQYNKIETVPAPNKNWKADAPTDNQLKTLEKHGIDGSSMTKGEASDEIGRIFASKKKKQNSGRDFY